MATNILHDSILMRSDLIVFSVGGRAGVGKGASGGEIGVNENFSAGFPVPHSPLPRSPFPVPRSPLPDRNGDRPHDSQ